MKISTKTKYGLRAIIYLAGSSKKGCFCSIKQIAESEDISPDYLEKIISKLEKAGILTAQKGARGGYSLARPAKEIKLGEVVNVLEGENYFVQCLGGVKSTCSKCGGCLAQNFWQKFQEKLDNFLNSVSLEDLIKNKF
jgi:Rrf2 family protein